MTDLSTYLAAEIADWMSQNTQLPTPSATIYVALFDDTGTEVTGDTSNGRVGVAAPGGWTLTDSGTAFENSAEVDFGEATADINNIQTVALYDSGTVGAGNEFAEYTIDQAPLDASANTRVFFPAGDLSFDIQDQ